MSKSEFFNQFSRLPYRVSCTISTICLSLIISSVSYAEIVINEIHYDPDNKTELVEFIELYNNGSSDEDLSGWTIRNAADFTFPNSTILAAGNYLVTAQNAAAVRNKYSVSSSKVIGPLEGRLDNNSDNVELWNADGKLIDRVEYQLGFPWPTVGVPVPENQPGTSHSIQLVNPNFDNDLAGNWRSASPTPSKQNSVFTDNIGPLIRQVRHAPQEPVSDQVVTILAKATDPDGVASVTLQYQVVDPGKYIHINDSKYKSQWINVAMNDDGLNGDKVAGDMIFAAELDSALQVHRRLIRYRIEAADSLGNTVTVPYSDDAQPNFAYFVYDGVPDWQGAARPGRTDVVNYSSEMLSAIPVYHLITSKAEAEKCTWFDHKSGNDYYYTGTIVFDGIVYDHVWFRARGGTWRFSMGKNMWKFNMNRGHSFQARDNYGKKFATQWDKINLGACIQQGDYMHRGEQGMFESVGFKLFNMAGLESANTAFIHFRIIDEEHEDGLLNDAHAPLTDEGTQYDGDFWGLYLATEQVDGRFLDEHNLPDGNLYKMEGGTGEIKNQSPQGVSDKSDMNQFMNDYRRNKDAAWWEANVDMDRYYNYRCIVEGIHQYDIAYGKNYYYYLNPESNKWIQLAWDLDLTWADNMFGDGEDPFKQAGVLRQEALDIGYQNRMREILDLLYNPDQTGQLINEFASFIYQPDALSFVDADRAMWDYHWAMSSAAANQGLNNPSKSGQGRFYQMAQTKDFPGMLKIMNNYVQNRTQWINRVVLKDNNAPNIPEVTAAFSNGYKIDKLTFETTPFSDPQGADTFDAMKWRIAEVEPYAKVWDGVIDEPVNPGQPAEYEIILEPNATWKYFKGLAEPSDPVSEWRTLGFNDASWESGQTPMGYGEDFLINVLDDMRYNYSTIYLRKKITINNIKSIGIMTAYALFDDGFNMWINGKYVAHDHVDAEYMPFDSVAEHREDTNYAIYELPDPKEFLVEGDNIIAVQVINQYIDRSSDCFIDLAIVCVAAAEEPEPVDDGGDDGEEPKPKPFPKNLTKPLKYEIDPIWESEEITTFNNSITIPADKVAAGKTYRVRVRMKDNTGRWSHWSEPVQFVTEKSSAQVAVQQNLCITEMMYNPPAGTEFEFIELHNSSSSQTLDLSGMAFANGIEYVFPNDTLIPPDGYLLLTNSATLADKADFQQHYQLNAATNIVGPYSGKLSNSGEIITLKASSAGQTLITFEFNDGRGWSQAADGAGHSLVPIESALATEGDGSLAYGGNWRASAFIGGSPGKADPEPVVNVVLNEFMANTSDASGANSNDWIELFNKSQSDVALQGWYLSDEIDDLKKWSLPPFQISAGGHISFDEQTGFNLSGQGFALSKDGEGLFLSYLPGTPGIDRVADAISFKAQEALLSLGHDEDGDAFWVTMEASRDQTNNQGAAHVVIDEMMYHPVTNPDLPDDNSIGEYIELYNPTARAIQLWNETGVWRLDGGVEFMLPPDTTIPAQGRILLVAFDPTVAMLRDIFTAAYNIDITNQQIIGPYSGNLSNSGERIALEKPMSIDPTDGSMSWSIVDEIIYFHQTPWPVEADGDGKSLQRISTIKSGNDPQNWKSASPTPAQESTPDTSVKTWMLY